MRTPIHLAVALVAGGVALAGTALASAAQGGHGRGSAERSHAPRSDLPKRSGVATWRGIAGARERPAYRLVPRIGQERWLNCVLHTVRRSFER
jgi:hypothetical protein